MSENIIEVRNLSKIYRKNVLQYQTLRDSLFVLFKNKNKKIEKKNIIQALDNINFDIKEGEKLGIIGPNGSGKTTLLKILSRITVPTDGYAIVRGRTASLLEVGTGFHGELTGRENIFFNGSILGMSKQEIKQKLDQIISFAQLEEYIDMPVKFYSSGMLLRLAFSVAAHLDADVLFIDEILAVGDAEFQQKTIGKMNEAAQTGRTIILVSHNLGIIEELCNRCILLHKGKIIKDDIPRNTIEFYFHFMKEKITEDFQEKNDKKNCIQKFYLKSKEGIERDFFFFDEELLIETHLKVRYFQKNLFLAIVLSSSKVSRLSVFLYPLKKQNDTVKISLIIPPKILAPGFYYFDVYLYQPGLQIHDFIEHTCPFRIVENNVPYGNILMGNFGSCFIDAKWMEE